VGKNKKHKKSAGHQISKRYIFVAVLVVIGTAVVTLLLLSIFNKPTATPEQLAFQKDAQSEAAFNDAQSAASSGDYNSGQAILDKAISDSTNDADTAWAYIQKSTVALNAEKFDEAYDFAKKSEDLAPTKTSVLLMANALEAKGDKSGAIANYELAASRITSNSELDDLDKQEIQATISQLRVQ